MTTVEHIAAAVQVRSERHAREAEYWRKHWAAQLEKAKSKQSSIPQVDSTQPVGDITPPA